MQAATRIVKSNSLVYLTTKDKRFPINDKTRSTSYQKRAISSIRHDQNDRSRPPPGNRVHQCYQSPKFRVKSSVSEFREFGCAPPAPLASSVWSSGRVWFVQRSPWLQIHGRRFFKKCVPGGANRPIHTPRHASLEMTPTLPSIFPSPTRARRSPDRPPTPRFLGLVDLAAPNRFRTDSPHPPELGPLSSLVIDRRMRQVRKGNWSLEVRLTKIPISPG